MLCRIDQTLRASIRGVEDLSHMVHSIVKNTPRFILVMQSLQKRKGITVAGRKQASYILQAIRCVFGAFVKGKLYQQLLWIILFHIEVIRWRANASAVLHKIGSLGSFALLLGKRPCKHPQNGVFPVYFI